MAKSVTTQFCANTTSQTRTAWETEQALPMLLTLVVAAICAVCSQLSFMPAFVTPFCVLGFGLCVLRIVRQFRQYRE